MKFHPLLQTLVNTFYVLKYVEKMFHYCAGIFIILFLRGLNFFSPFSALLAFVYIRFTAPFVSLRVQLEVLCFLHGNFMTLQQGAGTQDS